MAGFDRLAGQKKYESSVQMFYKSGLQALKPDKDVYGYAALQAYLAYGDDSFLQAAITSWQAALPAVLTDSDVSNGSSPNKNVTVASTCRNGATLTGGVFHDLSNPNTLGVTASATGDFSILSASLAAATSNRTYLDYATKSAEFLRLHLYQGNGVFANMLDTKDCTVAKSTFAYDTGCVMQALSLNAALTQNTTNILFLYDVVAGATTQNEWHDGSGVLSIAENGESLAHLMRGYTELYKGNNTPTDLKSYLKSYISNQYNAVTQISTQVGSNIYGPIWNESPTDKFSNQSQVAAISALLGGMIITLDASPGAGSDGNGNSNPSASGSVPKGAIAGGVVGGVLGLGLIIGGVWFYTRSRKRRQEEKETLDPEIVAAPWSPSTVTETDRSSSIPRYTKQSRNYGHRRDASRVTTNTNYVSESVDPPSSTTSPAGEVTTEDLLAVLAHRLRNERLGSGRGWDSHESPPQYVE
ncbi:hypothetical protein V5O48_004747 [Marasmius crinis-equi]|uniref:Glycoside hydrolase family 76 protein n=1 Tax=Marasmius crinis-equi TaxID=585013 RepID=A0ABR3FPN8_9AGAR